MSIKQYKNILACVDLSPVSREVLLRANDLAEYYQANLVVLYVNPDIPAVSEPFGEPPSLLLDSELRQQLEQQARDELKQLVINTGLPELTPTEMVDGYPKQEILEYAKKHKMELIVLGRHRRPRILELLGSTANTILHKAQADVLLIGNQETPQGSED